MQNQLQTLGFGAGIAIVKPTAGNLPLNPAAIEADVMQNFKFDYNQDIKSLKGQLKGAVDSAPGSVTMKGSFDIGKVLGGFLQNIGMTNGVSAGVQAVAYREMAVVPLQAPFTVSALQAATWVDDKGITYANTQAPLYPTSAAPTAGRYSVSNGVYTFSQADAGALVLVNYGYTVAATGQTFTMNNETMGYGPVSQLDLRMPYQGNYQGLLLTAVRFGKVGVATKQDDYTMFSVDFEAFFPPGQPAGYWYLPN